MSHECNNFLMTCIDFRFQRAIADWTNENGLTKDYDLVSIAGVQKSILDEDTKEAALKQLDISVRLHKVNTVMLIAHQDCGAYGGSDAFDSWEDEKQRYIDDMNAAEEIIVKKFKGLMVKKMILTFDEDNNVEINEV
jgi:carbonic anhydrase